MAEAKTSKTADASGTTPREQEHLAQNYWAIVRRQFRRSRIGMIGLAVLLFLLVVALLAPLLANDVPLIARYKGELCFPALPSYLDAFPIPSFIVDPLRKLKIGGRNPFSEYYPILGGKSWKEAISTDWDPDERGDWYIPPPIFWSYKEVHFSDGKKKPLTRTSWAKVEKGKGDGQSVEGDAKAGSNAGETDKEPSGPYVSIHLLGTDGEGRDVLARLIHGTIISLSVGVVAVSIYVTIGVILGLLAGYFGGWVDMILSRLTEVMICFPTFFLILTVIAFLPRSIYNIMIVIGLTSWPGVFRLMRGEVLKVKTQDYCTASLALGTSSIRTMVRHILPNAVQPVFVSATFGVAAAILIENSLSFLGFGVAPPTASWGEIVSQGREYVAEKKFYLTIAPGLAIFITVTSFNLVGQALRDAMDPRLRR